MISISSSECKTVQVMGLRGLKSRGLRWNQISILHLINQNDQRKKIVAVSETPTHIAATRTISKILEKFKDWILRELGQNFDIPRISLIYWITSKFLKEKNTHVKKLFRFLIPECGLFIWQGFHGLTFRILRDASR